MDSDHTLLDGSAASEPCNPANTQPGMAAAVQFPFFEDDLAHQLGFPEDKIRAARKQLVQGEHFIRENRRFRWSEVGLKTALGILRWPEVTPEVKNPADTAPAEKTAPSGPPAPAKFTITNMNFPNQRLLLCRDAAGAGAKVWIHPEWRPLFRVGMVIEATQGSSGDWRTRKPRAMGHF